MSRAAESVAIAASGVSLASLGSGYYSLAVAGAVIGIMAWFYGHTHADPRWSASESAAEALKFVLFGLLVMPAVVEGSAKTLEAYGLSIPSVRIMLGGIAAFVVTEMVSIGMRKLSSFRRRERYDGWGGERDE